MRSKQVFGWFGGKGQPGTLTWILQNIPRREKTTVYCEPFLGAGSVFLAQDPYPVEVLNDIDGEVVNFFRVCQDKNSLEKLLHKLSFTPYAVSEFEKALNILKTSSIESDPLLHAWAFFTAQNQSFNGSHYKRTSVGSWRRTFTSARNMAKTVSTWRVDIDRLLDFSERISRAQICQMDGIDCIKYWDSEQTLFYLDPPYVLSTRKCENYVMELTDSYHKRLIETLLTIKGSAVLSGYENDIYKELENAGWKVFKKDVACYAAGSARELGITGEGKRLEKFPRTECLWIRVNGKGHSFPKERNLFDGV